MLESGQIARLKITLDYISPAVTRRVEVPVSILLSDLHLVIQVCMPWWNYHLYEFRAGKMHWGLPDPDGDWMGGPPVLPAKKLTLDDLIGATGVKSFKYIYDFGDDWVHTIKIEKIGAAEPGVTYPRLLDAAGRCPPEDVGGPPGYEQYLEAIADPKHEQHSDLVAWRGPGFDPMTVDEANIRKQLAKLAKKWAGKGAKPAKPPRKAAKPAKPPRKVWTK